ncbi:hypothetical protein OAS37_00335 [Alphaproteobacteria bacterium]|nr:hypothetical protein [Alphaproteobacteria bacterium]
MHCKSELIWFWKSALQPFITELVRLVISADNADDVGISKNTRAAAFMRNLIEAKAFI